MKDIQSIQAIADKYISKHFTRTAKAIKRRPKLKVCWVDKKPRMKLSRILEDEVKKTLAFFLGVVIIMALASVALSPYFDTILSWI